MDRPTRGAWAKLVRDTAGGVSGWHSLPDHSADVAACLEALLGLPALGGRLARLAGRQRLPPEWRARLAVLAPRPRTAASFTARIRSDARS